MYSYITAGDSKRSKAQETGLVFQLERAVRFLVAAWGTPSISRAKICFQVWAFYCMLWRASYKAFCGSRGSCLKSDKLPQVTSLLVAFELHCGSCRRWQILTRKKNAQNKKKRWYLCCIRFDAFCFLTAHRISNSVTNVRCWIGWVLSSYSLTNIMSKRWVKSFCNCDKGIPNIPTVCGLLYGSVWTLV